MSNPVGRPIAMTEETLQKLREGFLMGYSDEEACLYAEISPATLYNYQKDNPEYIEQKEQWKTNPILKAKKVIDEALDKKDRDTARWYLERKKKKEFGNNLDLTSDGKELTQVLVKFIDKKDDEKPND